MNLFFAEHAYQVEDLLARCEEGRHPRWIALGPSAMHCLNEKGIPYHIPEDYCSPEEIEKACQSQFERLQKTCHELDAEMMRNDPFLQEWDIRPFMFHLWHIGMISDGLIGRALQLQKIMGHFPEAEVFAHLAPPKPFDIFSLGFHKEETLWGRLLTLPGWKNRIVTFLDPLMHILAKSNRSLKEKATNWYKDRIVPESHFKWNWALTNLFLSFRYGIPLNVLKMFSPDRRKLMTGILALDGICDWKSLLPLFVAKRTKIYFLYSQTLQSGFTPVSEENCPGTDELWNKFSDEINREIVDYRPLMKERIFWIIEQSSSVAKIAIENLRNLISDKNIHVAINGLGPYYLCHVAKMFCRKQNIPVLGWQHGANWFDNRITQRGDLEDLLTNNIHLVYGDGNKKAYELSNLNSSCRVISVGSVSLDGVTKKTQKKKLPVEPSYKILYVITNYYRNSWYCGFTPPFSDRFYFQQQHCIIKKLLSILNNQGKISLTIKLHPSAMVVDENPPWVDALRDTENVHLNYAGSTFVELLKDHDVIIVDSPTTTLLQAISTRLPVFVLTSVIAPPSVHLALLKKRAVCAETGDALMDILEAYIQTGVYPANIDNREFLKLYGTYVDDGKSHVRAMKIIEDMVPALKN